MFVVCAHVDIGEPNDQVIIHADEYYRHEIGRIATPI